MVKHTTYFRRLPLSCSHSSSGSARIRTLEAERQSVRGARRRIFGDDWCRGHLPDNWALCYYPSVSFTAIDMSLKIIGSQPRSTTTSP